MKSSQFNSNILTVYLLSIILLTLIIDPIAARVVNDRRVDEAAAGPDLNDDMVKVHPITEVITVTRFVPSTTTSILFTASLCVELSTSGSLTPTQCRSRSSDWNGHNEEEPLLYLLYDKNGEDVDLDQLGKIHPSKVLTVKTTELAKFRDGIPSTGPVTIESSLETKEITDVRDAQPLDFVGLASILSSKISGFVQPTITRTRTSTVYVGGTSVVTIYTSTNSYTLIGSCYPAFPPLCSK